MARIPLEDTPIYAQLLQEQQAKEAFALFFEYDDATEEPDER